MTDHAELIADMTLLTDDLEYWRLFLLRSRQYAKGRQRAPIHIDHLTAAAVCIGNAIKSLGARGETPAPDIPCTAENLRADLPPRMETPAPEGWQPMDTAPKDWQTIDIWCSSADGVEQWRETNCIWSTARGGSWSNSRGWWDCAIAWMPLPAPPARPSVHSEARIWRRVKSAGPSIASAWPSARTSNTRR